MNTRKGSQMFAEISHKIYFEERTLEEASTSRMLSHPFKEPNNRKELFVDYQNLKYEELAKKYFLDKGLKGLIKRVIPRSWIFHIRKI